MRNRNTKRFASLLPMLLLFIAIINPTSFSDYTEEVGNAGKRHIIGYREMISALSDVDGITFNQIGENTQVHVESIEHKNPSWFKIEFSLSPYESAVVEFVGSTNAPESAASTGAGFIVDFYGADGEIIGETYRAYCTTDTELSFHRYCYTAPLGTAYGTIRLFTRENTSFSINDFNLYVVDSLEELNPSSAIKYDGHLGATFWAPRNTMPSLILSKAAGFKSMIVNVRATSDDTLVCVHDATIDATSNGRGELRDYTYEQLLNYDFGSWFNPIYANTKIMTFKEAAEFICDSGMSLGTSIHRDALNNFNIKELCNIYRDYGQNNGSYVKSFDFSILSRVYLELGDSVEYIWDCSAKYENIDKAAGFNGKCIVEFPIDQITEDIVAYANKKNVDVSAYFGNDSRKVSNVYRMGVKRFCIDTSQFNVFPLAD